MAQGAPICFGDIIQLRAKSAFADDADDAVVLSFMEQSSSNSQPLLMVPPKDPATTATLKEAEFLVMPVRGEKQQAPGTPLTYKTPFTLCTNEMDRKKDKEIYYSLNNKVSGHKDGVTLQPAQVKGEMFLTLDKEGFTAETIVHEGDVDFQVVVVDSNRIRKSLNHPLAHFVKPKSVGALVGCGVAKNSKPLAFSVCKLKKESNKTEQFVKDAKFRRASMESLEPPKADETGRPEVADSDASEMEARSRHASLVSQPSASVMAAPASPTTAAAAPAPAEAPTASATTTASVSEPMERSVASEREAEHSTAVLGEAATALHEAPAAAVETPEAVAAAPEGDVAAEPVGETAAAAETASTAEVAISEAFTSASEAQAPATMTTMSSTAVDADEELDADVGSDKAMCVGGIRCCVM